MKPQRLILLALLTFGLHRYASAQTSIVPAAIRCPQQTGSVMVPVASGVTGLPFVTLVCAQLDPAGFVLDKTTNPWTLRIVVVAPPTGTKEFREALVGTIDGTNPNFTLSSTPDSSHPVFIIRNGLVLTACPVPMTASVNCDYQQSGNTILFVNGSQAASGTAAIPVPNDLISVVYWH